VRQPYAALASVSWQTDFGKNSAAFASPSRKAELRILKPLLLTFFLAVLFFVVAATVGAQIPNGDFEIGNLANWTTNGTAFVSGTPGQGGTFNNAHGTHFATSWRVPGDPQEGSVGSLRSADFKLTKNRLSFLAAGWQGRGGQPPVLCYVALCLAEDGRELDRLPAPNTSGNFVLCHLDVDPALIGRQVYILVVDNNPDTVAENGGFQYIAVDDFKLENGPQFTPIVPFAFDPKTMFKLEDQFHRVELRKDNGAILRVVDKAGWLELCRMPQDAENFSLVTSGGDTIAGKDQALSSCETNPMVAVLRWDGPLKTTQGGRVDASVSLRIELAQGAVRFKLDTTNRSSQRLSEIDYPIVGGAMFSRDEAPIGRCTLFASDSSFDLPARYEGSYPGAMAMPWIEIASRERGRGLFFADLDPRCRYKSVRVEKAGVSRADGGQVIGRFYWHHTPHLRTGSFDGPPVALRFHENDLQQSCRFYRDWFEAQFGAVRAEQSWLRQDPCYQDVMLLLPEGNVNMRFKDLPRYAADGLKCGMKTIMISGWNLGGHDGWYPYYEPDPRLGTWNDLQAALAEVHRLGARALFFVNYSPVHPGTKWFNDELHRYYLGGGGGFGMGTIGARLSITHTELGGASAASTEYCAIIVRQMKKLAEIGADGLHFDKLLCGNGVNTRDDLPAGVDADFAESGELIKGIDEVARACRAIRPDFAFSFESAWDRVMPYSEGCHWWGEPGAGVMKMTFPEYSGMTSIAQPYDYNILNNCVLQAYHCMIGPKCYTASIGDPIYTPLARYLGEVMKIWEEQKQTIFLGERLSRGGLELAGSPAVGLNTYRNRANGLRAAVLANSAPTSTTVELRRFADSSSRRVKIYQPYRPVRDALLPATLILPGEQLAVIAEETNE
jgi:hypothetical protein